MEDEIVSGTGHRPDKLGGYEPEANERLIVYAVKILPSYRPKKVISGAETTISMLLHRYEESLTSSPTLKDGDS